MRQEWSNTRFDRAVRHATEAIIRAAAPLQRFFVTTEAEEPYESFGQMALTASRGALIRVSKANSASCVWSPEVNVLARMWHDWTHIVLGEDFSLAGELATGKAQLRQLALIRQLPTRGDDVARVIYADVIGQVLAHGATGRFPVNQAAFVRAYVEDSAATLAAHGNGDYDA